MLRYVKEVVKEVKLVELVKISKLSTKGRNSDVVLHLSSL